MLRRSERQLCDKETRLAARLADARSRRVVFLAHCLLNQNVRYLGGASHGGVVPSVVEPRIREGVGLYQMPCPEQVAWGGVMKRLLLRCYGAERTWFYRLRAVLYPIFLLYTRWRYWRLARRVAKDIADYVRSEFEIVGVVGVHGSPSCGARHTLDMRRSLPVVASLDVERLQPAWFNDHAVRAFIVAGQGMYIAALQRQLRRRGVSVSFSEYVAT